MNHKEIRQKGARMLRKVSDSMPKDKAMKSSVIKDSYKGGTESTRFINPSSTLTHSGKGSKGNPKNADY